MTRRNALILAVIALAIGPACLVVFGDGHAAARRSSPPVTAAAPATANAKVSVDAGCVDRPLSYGLTNDQARGEAYDRSLLDPFASHPPLPKAGYYPPGRSPDQAALIHALYHGYVVVRYRPALASIVKRDLRAPSDGRRSRSCWCPGVACRSRSARSSTGARASAAS